MDRADFGDVEAFLSVGALRAILPLAVIAFHSRGDLGEFLGERAVGGRGHRDSAREDFELPTSARVEFDVVELHRLLREFNACRDVVFVRFGGNGLRVDGDEVRFDPFRSRCANAEGLELGVCRFDKVARIVSTGFGFWTVCAGCREQ